MTVISYSGHFLVQLVFGSQGQMETLFGAQEAVPPGAGLIGIAIGILVALGIVFVVFLFLLKIAARVVAGIDVSSSDAVRTLLRFYGILFLVSFLLVAPITMFLMKSEILGPEPPQGSLVFKLISFFVSAFIMAESVGHCLQVSFGDGVKIVGAMYLPVALLIGVSAVNNVNSLPGQKVGNESTFGVAPRQNVQPPFVSSPSPTDTKGDWQHGEPILPAETKNAPLRRHEKSPWFQISNFRKLVKDENGFATENNQFVIDYKREGNLDVAMQLVMVVRNSSGQEVYEGAFPTAIQGTITGRDWSIKSPRLAKKKSENETELEIWLETRERWPTSARTKISNSLTLGNISGTYARHWTHNELMQYDKYLRGKRPLPPKPDDAEMVTKAGQLIPGLPVLYGYEGEWRPFEVIDVQRQDEKLALISGDFGDIPGSTLASLHEVPWASLAVKSSDLQQAAADASRFRPSVRVLPGGTSKIPDGMVIATDATPLVPGTPVKIDIKSSFHDGLIAEMLNNGDVSVIWFGGFEKNSRENLPRSKVVISPRVAEGLKNPEAKERLAVRAELATSGVNLESLSRDYVIDTEVPLTSMRIPADLPLPKGTLVSFCKHRHWYEGTVLDVNYLEPEKVVIKSDKFFGHTKEGEFDRDHLIIAKYDLAKIPGGEKFASRAPAGPSTGPVTSPSAGPAKGADPGSPPANTSSRSGWGPVLESTPLVIGTPVKVQDQSKNWEDATIKDLIDHETVELFKDQWGTRRTETKRRSELMITAKALDALNKPDAASRFAPRAEGGADLAFKLHRDYPKSEYSIRLPIPAKAVRVTKETPLQPGTICGLCLENQWAFVRIATINWDDTVGIEVNQRSWSYNGKIDRECLVIEKKVLDRLLASAGVNQTGKIAETATKSSTDKSEMAKPPKVASSGADTKGAAKEVLQPRASETDKSAEKPAAPSDPAPPIAPPVIDKLLQVEADTPLMLGVPVKAIDVFKNWSDATVAEIHDNGKVEVIWDKWGSRKEELSRSDLKIRTRVMDVLKQPGIEARFATRLERIQNSVRSQLYPKSEYSIRIPIPAKGVRVTKETPLEAGTQVAANSGGRWVDLTVIDLNWDDTVRVHVNRQSEHYDGDIDRDCLIIDKKILAQLQAKNPQAAAAAPTAPPAAPSTPATTTSPAPPPVAGKYQVVLKSLNMSKRIPVATAISNGTGLGLREALTLILKVPVVLKTDLDKDAAEKLRKDVEEAGGNPEVKAQ